MLISFQEITANEYSKILLGAIFAFIIGTFLVPRLSEFIRALTSFIFLNPRHWISFITFGFILYFVISLPLLVSILISIIITTTISAFFSFRTFTKKPTLVYFGTYFNNDNNYINKNFKTEQIDSIIEEEIDIFRAYSYLIKSKLVEIKTIDIPKFYILVKNYKKLTSLFKILVTKSTVFGFSFFIDSDYIHYKSYLNINRLDISAIFKENLEAIQDILENTDISERVKITLTIKVNLMVFTQSFNDMFLQLDDFAGFKYSLEDNLKLINSVKQDLKINRIESDKAINFVRNFECSYHRFSSILAFNQANYQNGIKHIFESLKLNPYFPYDNNEEFKRLFITRYYLELLPNIIANEDETSRFFIDTMQAYEVLLLRVEENIIFFTIDIYKEYILGNELLDNDIKFIEEGLNTLDDNVANLIFKTEVLKFLPKGIEKFNEIYVDRIEECIVILNKINDIDPSFPLIHLKIGNLKLALATSTGNECLLKDALGSIKIGLDELKNIGLDLARDEIIE